MPLRLYNTLSGKIEEFRPLADNQVRMYACGPTVYDYGHIGNFRTFIAVDGLRRFLRQSGYQVRHVMNITDVDEYAKDNARDFALWKAAKPGEAFWETPIGPGRPGWHIECSVMSMEELGETFDLHAGGEDLIFPHHENEIAQSEAMTGKPFVHFWFHARFLLVEGEKMSKSLGNFFTLRDLVLKGHKPSSIRYLLASV